MGEMTLIAWTNHTFNIAWGCAKVDPGCANCYAEAFAVGRKGLDIWGPKKPRRTFGPDHWKQLQNWHRKSDEGKTVSVWGDGKPALVFCSSMCDVFEDHPTIDAEREKLWPIIRDTPALHYQLLTKRPENINDRLPNDWGKGYPNVWLGTSICEEKGVWRADRLREVPAVCRFISYEPALGPIDGHLNLQGIHWLIYGGESGRGFRPHNLDWPRAIRKLCKKWGTAFFYKQSSAIRTEMGTTLDGEVVREFPQFTPRRFNGALL